VVDDKHKLIVAAEATSAGNDIGQLAPMAEAAKSALGIKEAEVFADAGYWKEEDIAACERAGLLPYVPVPDTERAVRDAGRLPASVRERRSASTPSAPSSAGWAGTTSWSAAWRRSRENWPFWSTATTSDES
jgi:hypothetical protein